MVRLRIRGYGMSPGQPDTGRQVHPGLPIRDTVPIHDKLQSGFFSSDCLKGIWADEWTHTAISDGLFVSQLVRLVQGCEWSLVKSLVI